MVKRWLVLLLVLLSLAVVSLPISEAACAYCNGGSCNDICESGETTACNDCNKYFCQDSICDPGLGEDCNSCPSDCGYCDGHSCTSGGQCQGRYCVCGECDSTPPPGSYCCGDGDCDLDYCGSWGSNYCYDDDVYRQRTCHDFSCVSMSCSETTSIDRQKVQECGTQGCSGGSCVTCTSRASFSCKVLDQDIYWKDSCGNWEEEKEDCGHLTQTGTWGTHYCKNGNVYENRTNTVGGCYLGDTTCRVTSTDFEERLVEECPNGCTNGACTAGCSDDPACTSASATGCSLDFVKRWWCEEGLDGCLDQVWETCVGRCDASSHQCVPGCTSNANCDDNNPCTLNQCTQATGACMYPPDTSANGATCDYLQHPGIGDGRCDNGVCSCFDPSSDSQVCNGWTCGTSNDYCGVPRTCLPGCSHGYSCVDGGCLPGGGCSSNGDCSGETPICDTNTGYCVTCIEQSHCDDADVCTVDTCVLSVCSHVVLPPACPPADEVPCGDPVTSQNACPGCAGTGTLCGVLQVCLDLGGWGCQDCVDAAPSPSAVLCGTTTTGQLCNGQQFSVVGTGCSQGAVCIAGTCEATVFTILQADVAVVAPNTVVLNPVLSAASGAVPLHFFSYEGWMSTNTKNVGHTDVGRYDVTITAYRQTTGAPLATANPAVSIFVNCNPGDPNYGPCCLDGSYLPDSSSCIHGDTDPGETWQCVGGRCVEYCTPHSSQGCVGTVRYWYDSCGQRGAAIFDCAIDGELCVENGGQTECVDQPPSCSGEYNYFCRENNVWRRDTGCGLTQQSEPCSAHERCEEENNQAWCEAQGPCDAYPGTMFCDSCVDPLTNRLHCGGCDRACGRNEQCVQGTCALIPGCVVICDTNDECGAGYVCVSAGSCTESRCEAVDVLKQPVEAVEQLAGQLTDGIVQVDVTMIATGFRFSAYNLGPTILENVTVTAEFQKLLAESADGLIVEETPYVVLEQDPVLAFTLPPLQERHDWTVTVRYAETLDPSYANLVSILDIDYQSPDLLAAWNDTKDLLAIGLNSEFDGENTKFHLTLNPSKGLGALSVPIEIPKCMAAYASELQLDGNYRIVEEDPLIVWRFEKLDAPTAITFSVPGDIDEECKAQLRAMAYAGKIGKPINPWLTILLVPLIGVLLIFFQRFAPGMQPHKEIPKQEYFAIGRQQGRSDEDLEREWRDYKRRF